MTTQIFEEFLKDRREALLSLDKVKIDAYMMKYGERSHPDEEVYWRGIHKAITASTDLPIEFRRKSKEWLIQRGSDSLDDGDI